MIIIFISMQYIQERNKYSNKSIFVISSPSLAKIHSSSRTKIKETEDTNW